MAATDRNSRARVRDPRGNDRSGTETGSALRLILLALFLASAATAGVSAWQGWRSHSFVEVEGEIVEVTVNRIEDKSDGMSRKPRESRYLGIVYAYDFKGITYRGDRIEAGSFGLANGADFGEFRSRLEVGRRVPVYVDPADPHFAVLERGTSNMLKMFLALTGFLGFANMIARGMRNASRPARRGPQRSSSPVS